MSVARIYRVGSPYNGSELPEVDFEQSADTMYMAHLDHPPTKLVRTAHTNWTFSEVLFAPGLFGPATVDATFASPNTTEIHQETFNYTVTALNDATGQESRAGDTATVDNDLSLNGNRNFITWSAVTGADRYRIYKSDNAGDFGYIGTTTSLNFTDNNIAPQYQNGVPLGQNPFEGAGNYPSTVAFFEQRLVWARTKNNPNAVYTSRSGEFENMDITRPLRASDAITFKLVAGRVNAVNQLVSMDSLICVTSDSIFKITGGTEGFISPLSFISKRQNGRGGSRLGPLVIDANAFYQTSVGNAIRVIGYEFQTDSTQSNDVTIYSPHFFRGFNVVSWAYAQEPRSIIWAARDDGKLLCFTWEKEQEVWGWTLCETDGLVETVCVISEGGEDRLYMTVRRGGRLLIERMAAARWDTIDDTCFLDSAISYAFDTPQTVLNNLDHLNGRTIKVLADGDVVSGLVVAGGKVTLPNAVSVATAGLPFTAEIETLPLAFQGSTGSVVNKPQSSAKALVRVINSRGIKAGPTVDKLDSLRPRNRPVLGQPAALENGVLETFTKPHISGGSTCVVQSSDPLPLTITGILLDPSVAG